MKNLKTKYMGIGLDNPVIVGASNLSKDNDKLKQAEDHGAGAIVFKSLFEEQIQLESYQMEEWLREYDDLHAEMITIHPHIEHSGPDEHLMKVSKARESLSIPLIASLNAIELETWIKYARLLAQTGVDGLELNFYQIPSDFDKSGNRIEEEQIEIVREVKKNVSIPVSIKLSAEYSNILNFVKKLDEAGADGFVLFNSFFQPDISITEEQHTRAFNFSKEGDYRQSLRYTGLLYDNIQADICSSRGIFSGADVIRMLLCGAGCVQVVSTLYKNGMNQLTRIKNEMEEWMEQKNYGSLDEFRGKLSKSRLPGNPFVYKRAQYVDLILFSENIFGRKH